MSKHKAKPISAASPPTADIPAPTAPRRAHAKKANPSVASTVAPQPSPRPSKLDLLETALTQSAGATLPDLMALTGWQAHSVRGAIAGALKQRGHAISSTRVGDEPRRYRIEAPTGRRRSR